jgi:hypothetical protein
MLETLKRIAVRNKKSVLKTIGVSFSIPNRKAKTTPFMPSRIPAFVSAKFMRDKLCSRTDFAKSIFSLV